MKVFKLVTNRRGVLESWNECGPDVRVEYKPGKWAHPQVKGTPLFAFRSEWEARAWTGDSFELPRDTELWEAEAPTAYRFNPLAYGQSQFGIVSNRWKQLWKNWQKKTGVEDFRGVVLCSKLKLTRRIK